MTPGRLLLAVALLAGQAGQPRAATRSGLLPARSSPMAQFTGEAQPLADSLDRHLGSLNFLLALPEAEPWPEFSTRPPDSITELKPDVLAASYLEEMRVAPGPGDAEAQTVIAQVALRPDLAGPARTLLPPGSPTGEAVLEWGSKASQLTRGKAAPALVAVAESLGSVPDRAEGWERLRAAFDEGGRRLRSSPSLTVDWAGQLGDAAIPALRDPLLPKAEPWALRPSAQVLAAWFEPETDDALAWAFSGVDMGYLRRYLAPAPEEIKNAVFGRGDGGPYSPPQEPRERAALLAKLLFLRNHIEGSVSETFRSLPRLLSAYRARGLKGAPLRAVLDQTVRGWDGGYSTPLNHMTWRAMSPEQRKKTIEALDPAAHSWLGVRLTLRLRPGDDLAAVARKYALGRRPGPVERYLNARVRAGGGAEVSVPLQEILTRSIRRGVGRFEECTGPNCANTVLNSRRGFRARPAWEWGPEVLAVLRAECSELDAELEEPQAGDVLYYEDREGGMVHLSLSVGDGYVYAKNGTARLRPHIFQRRAENEELYAAEYGELRLRVFRPR